VIVVSDISKSKVKSLNSNSISKDRSSFKARMSYAVQSLRRSPVGTMGVVLILLVLFFAILGPNVSPHDPTQHNLRARYKPPGFTNETGTYLLGTDQLGRDVLSRVIAGSRVSVVVGLTSVVIAGTIGVVYGLIAGFVGGRMDALLMRIADALLGTRYAR
jgi:peptide/nickel transport system permease protein